MLVLDLALKSLRNRLLVTSLTVGSIALSVALLLGVEKTRTGMRESFSNTISQTDLIVGPKSGTIQLLLYSVFGMGSPTQNISWEAYEHWASHPAVDWTIPYALGDSHRGFRVIGTDENFYEHYRYRGGQSIELAEGEPALGVHDVAIGSQVAEELGYGIGDEIAVTHGMGGFIQHDEAPFRISGILAPTFTPVDRAIYVTMEGVEAMHEGWEDGVPPASAMSFGGGPPGAEEDPGEAGVVPDDPEHAGESPEEHAAHAHEPTQVTAFFVGATNRRDVLSLQRDISEWSEEPVMAVLPGLALSEMWDGLGYAEEGLRLVGIFVVIVGLLGMLVSLYTSLDARRREMAILRAVGAGPVRILSLLVLESALLATLGAILGVAVVYGGLSLAQPWVESEFGLYLPVAGLAPVEYAYLGAVILAGFLIGFVPALKAYRTALHDGLAVRV
ncbi:MAG TPA: FtsX-like permease family protein [Longimicrobiales bacterium]|nr:FtsX-like permease family protein [Longimicrobiales bacterium]